MRSVVLKTMIIVIMLVIVGCEINERYQNNLNSQNQHEDMISKVVIKGYYDEPASIWDKNTIILEGLSEGEFIEIVIQGEIENFEYIRLAWNDKENNLEEKETINKFDRLQNQTIVIKTYMPEGIPFEKVKWESNSGKEYELIIAENSLDGMTENEWEFILD